ncbi:MAG: ABC transporter permease subunit [Actinomycetota bacterium]
MTTTTPTPEPPSSTRERSTATATVPFWRNVRVLAWTFQLVVLALVIVVLSVLFNNVRINSQNQGIPTGFDFLDQPTSFTIPANDLRDTQPVRDAIVEGTLNTLRVSIVGIILATVLGVLVGIGRLSGNWLVRNLARVYVEALRNIPLLGLVVFAYLAIVLTLPRVDESIQAGNVLIINTRGASIPWPDGTNLLLVGLLVLAGIAGWLVRRWRLGLSERTGEPSRVVAWVTPVVLLVLFWGAVLAGVGVTSPSIDGPRVTGGMTLQPEYFALLMALVTYTASHIAEIVRGSIQAVPRGQGEAAKAMALTGVQQMRHVVLPQAFRIAIPPMANQYLNLMKNSSLGFVISYFELTKVVSTTIGNRSPAIPAYLVLILIYLVLSLIISLIMNTANRRLELPSR